MAINVGGIITIPIDIVTLATTMSSIKNGIKIWNPIKKAVFSSLSMNAGNSAVKGTSSYVVGGDECVM